MIPPELEVADGTQNFCRNDGKRVYKGLSQQNLIQLAVMLLALGGVYGSLKTRMDSNDSRLEKLEQHREADHDALLLIGHDAKITRENTEKK